MNKFRYRINGVKLKPQERRSAKALHSAAVRKIASKLGIPPGRLPHISDIEIIKESIDARRKPDVRLVYTLDFSCREKINIEQAHNKEYNLSEILKIKNPDEISKIEPAYRPVIAGFGPCGMFAGLVLAEAGFCPIILERGKQVDERIRDVTKFWQEYGSGGAPDPESNVQFGEGGAGTFSDGKLTTGKHDIRNKKVLNEFVQAGADPEILYMHRPHLGTDKLRSIVKNIRHKIEDLGGEIIFSTRLEGLILDSSDCGRDNAGSKSKDKDKYKGNDADVTGDAFTCNNRSDSSECPAECKTTGASDGGGHSIQHERNEKHLTGIKISRAAGGRREESIIRTDKLILATGHSARDTFRMLFESGLDMKPKPFSIGFRIEHPQEVIDKAQYGDPGLAEFLGAAAYKLNHRCENGRGVYTFCMCPGGYVINASTEPETMVTNGMSNSGRDSGYANSALLVDVRTDDFDNPQDPLAGIDFQRKYEKLAWENRAISTYGNFRKDKGDTVRSSLPEFAADAIIEAMPHLGRKLKGFDDDTAVIRGVEARSSSPVRIFRDKQMNSNINGIIPAGEGAGHAGGIMSAAADGIRAAEAIIRDTLTYASLNNEGYGSDD